MAKTDDPGFLELHVEKIFLAAAVIMVPVLLTFMVARGPLVEVVINGRAHSPDDVDKVLKDEAERVQKQIDAAKPEDKPIPDWAAYVATRYENPTPSRTLTPWVSGPPRLESVEAPKEIRVALGTLVEALPAPDKPVATAQPEVLMKPKAPPAGGTPGAGAIPAGQLLPTDYDYEEVIGVHVAAVFERGKAMAAWDKALEKIRVPGQLIVMDVEAQRQHRLADGSWGEPVPVSITRVPEQAPFAAIPRPDGKNLPQVLSALAQLQSAQAMQWICEPEYWTLFKDGQPANWIENKPRTKVSDLAGVVQPAPTPGMFHRSPRDYTSPGERYPTNEDMRSVPNRTINPRTNTRVNPGGPAMDPFGPGGYLNTGPQPPNVRNRSRRVRRPSNTNRLPPGVEPGMYGPAPPGVRRTRYAPRTTVPPSRMTTPPNRMTPPPVSPREPVEPAPAKPTPYVPPLLTQLADPAGIFEVWLHDTTPELGRQYRYRLRLVVVSPLLGRPGVVKDKADADKLSVATPWSEWSEPVGVQKSPEFFLTGSMSMMDRVAVTVFKEKWGQQISERFNVGRGQRIRKKVSRKLMYYDGTEKPVEIDFDTGAWAVDFAFKVPVPRSGGIFSSDTELIYIDAKGGLNRRSLQDDQNSQRFKTLTDRVEMKAKVVAARPWPGGGAP